MPDRIKTLDNNTISQIAAGEVIEGPSAVLKEMCENSLDAGALSISVVIEAGGKNLVLVTDDGIGMSGDDLKAAFQRHSTSKIRTAEELSTVVTLGFRGEALASITAVARVEAMSREQGVQSGHKIYMEDGNDVKFSPVGCAEGTTVAVKDLFYNTPARKEFLKEDRREAAKCMNAFRSLALSKPNVEWKYNHKGKQKIHLPPVTLKERIADLLGEERGEGLREVDFVDGDYRIYGYVGDKEHTGRNREYQYLFLNGRRINDLRLGNSIFFAYGGMVDKGDYPYYFLFLEMEPSLVDVNVHPAKLEVRFRMEKEVNDFVKRAVHRALGFDSIMSASPERAEKRPPIISKPPGGKKMTLKEYRVLVQPPSTNAPERDELMTLPLKEGEAEVDAHRFIPDKMFQLQGKYVVAQVKGGMVIIDQHAAHERVLYEKALASMTAGKAPAQKLVFPGFIEFPHGESDAFEEMLPWLEKMGFAVKPAGPRVYQVETVPAGLKVPDEIRLLHGMLEYYRENEVKHEDNTERIAAAYACKAAIKSGDSLTPEEMVGLIEALFRTGTSFVCPHGRPTYIKIDLKELDRRFRRS